MLFGICGFGLLIIGSFSFSELIPAAGAPGGGFSEFSTLATALTSVAEDFRDGDVEATRLQTAVAEVRLSYKRVAWLTEYYYPSYSTKHFNGAPLLKAEKYGTHSTVQPPEGLQVLDEMVHVDSVDTEQVVILARTLANHAAALAPEMATRPYPLAELLEAMRTELVRIPTLYLTGFDTPGSLAGLSESRVALESMHRVLSKQDILASYTEYATLRDQFSAAVAALHPPIDFDAFDRLSFQRDHLNGLYRGLASLQRAAGLPPSVRFPTGRNPYGQELLYADDFLDPYHYTELSARTDGPALRQLGERLFHDASLSQSGTLSCASCHQPDLAFTDGGAGGTARNAPTLVNAVYADRYFYDLRAYTLEQQAEHVIYDHGEFDTDYGHIVEKLRSTPSYQRAFRGALGRDSEISRSAFSAALASYVLSLRSFNSPFDRYARGEVDTLSEPARNGYNLFMGKAGCGTCHFAPTFSGLVPPLYTENESEILGVLENPHAWTKTLSPDRGRMAGGVPHEEVWIYDRSFKTPTVRNAALTGPYFHNGAYANLDLVVDFYDRGGGAGMGLEVPNQTLPPDKLSLTEREKRELVEFMHALTDNPPAPSRKISSGATSR